VDPVANLRPRANLERILDDLGATLLDLVHGDADSTADIGGVVIHDPIDEPTLPTHALVLGVAVQTPEQVVALLQRLGEQGAAGLVLRAPVPTTPDVAEAARRSGVAVLGLSRGAPWAHLAAMLRAMLAEGDVGVAEPESLGGLPSGDLFAVANAVAALLDAPITIEDRNSRVLAFSGRQDEADPSRVETILGRQVPERYSRLLSELGVFSQLHRSEGPVYIEPTSDGEDSFTMPRAAIAVRAGDEVLGSIWAAVPGPLTPERTDAFREAAQLVALHLLRIRAGADVQRRLRADLLSSALEGGAGAREALDRLGLAGQRLVVLAVGGRGPDRGSSVDAPGAAAHDRERLGDAFAVHLGATHARSAAALVGDVVYGLLPVPDDQGDARASRVAHDFLDRVGDRSDAVVGIGPEAGDAAGLAAARVGADRALRVLRERRRTARVAVATDVAVDALMLDLRDLAAARGEGPGGALARLVAYDRRHRAQLVETLRAWLDAFGDVTTAAASQYVHPNTFRYRLRRAAEVGEIDLDDAESRFSLTVSLRVYGDA
jgi:hypothetical protein